MNRLRCGVHFFDSLQDLQLMFFVAVLQNHSLENPFLCKKKIKKRKKKNIPRRYEVYKSAARLFSCRTKRKRAIPWGHDMTWHTHTARSCRQSEDRITVITITLRTKWYGRHIELGVFMATFSTLNIVQRW